MAMGWVGLGETSRRLGKCLRGTFDRQLSRAREALCLFRPCARCCRALFGSHGVDMAGLRRRPEVVACFALLNSTSNHAGWVGCRRGGTWRVACLGSDGKCCWWVGFGGLGERLGRRAFVNIMEMGSVLGSIFTKLDHCLLCIVSEDILRRPHLLPQDPADAFSRNDLEHVQNPCVISTHHDVLVLRSDDILLPHCSSFAGSL
jgi:hypothetical protein